MATGGKTDQGGAADVGPCAPDETSYERFCSDCHDRGAAGAPALGDETEWPARVARGRPPLLAHALDGYEGDDGICPPRGGHADASDDQVCGAVELLIEPFVEWLPQPSGSEISEARAVYESTCIDCHGESEGPDVAVAGAPRLGDDSAWERRVEKGREVLYDHATYGYEGANGICPPRGGLPELTRSDVELAVDYMIARVGS